MDPMTPDAQTMARCVADEVIRCKLPLDTTLGDEHDYASLPLCVIDAVFSMGVKYASTKLVPPRWAKAQTPQWPLLRREATVEHSISEFLEAADRFTSDELANDIFKNRQRTSSTSGILKAEAVKQYALALQKAGIERFADCDDETTLGLAEAYVKNIKGHSSGISFDYFRILIGQPTSKPDRMICKFVARAAGLDRVSPAVAKRAVIDATELLKAKYPNLTARVLDYVIWNYESRKSDAKPSKQPQDTCRDAMTGELHHMWIPAPILTRGFWLYVWKVGLPDGDNTHYVGMTGDVTGVAQSASNRVSAHLGSNVKSNALRRNLRNRLNTELENCKSFDLFAFGPVYEYPVQLPDIFKAQREKVANLERHLWLRLHEAQYPMLNKRPDGNDVIDAGRWPAICAAFQKPFPKLSA
jgi:hypothetical protein